MADYIYYYASNYQKYLEEHPSTNFNAGINEIIKNNIAIKRYEQMMLKQLQGANLKLGNITQWGEALQENSSQLNQFFSEIQTKIVNTLNSDPQFEQAVNQKYTDLYRAMQNLIDGNNKSSNTAAAYRALASIVTLIENNIKNYYEAQTLQSSLRLNQDMKTSIENFLGVRNLEKLINACARNEGFESENRAPTASTLNFYLPDLAEKIIQLRTSGLGIATQKGVQSLKDYINKVAQDAAKGNNKSGIGTHPLSYTVTWERPKADKHEIEQVSFSNLKPSDAYSMMSMNVDATKFGLNYDLAIKVPIVASVKQYINKYREISLISYDSQLMLAPILRDLVYQYKFDYNRVYNTLTFTYGYLHDEKGHHVKGAFKSTVIKDDFDALQRAIALSNLEKFIAGVAPEVASNIFVHNQRAYPVISILNEIINQADKAYNNNSKFDAFRVEINKKKILEEGAGLKRIDKNTGQKKATTKRRSFYRSEFNNWVGNDEPNLDNAKARVQSAINHLNQLTLHAYMKRDILTQVAKNLQNSSIPLKP